MSGRRSKLWATVAVIPSLLILLSLGFWQIDRLHQKEALLARIAAGMQADPVPLPAGIDGPDAWDYRRVQVFGIFLHDREFHLHRRSADGRGGYHVLTPLLREDGSAVLVDRGWVPPQLKEPASRSAGQVEGPVAVTGVARLPAGSGLFTPPDEAADNLWYHVDLAAMTARLGRPLVPLVVEADDTPNPGGYPLGGQTEVNIPNNHLQYVVTWFGFALSLLVIYIVYMVRRR
ncbi:MAG TPA: SURF1 family protein [Sphingomonadales bacterium]